MVVPEWIRPIRDRTMELMARREQRELTYIVKLFLHPNYTETPMETAAPWFLALLTSRDGSYHTLIEEVCRLNNPAAVAEVYQYCTLDDE